MNIALFGSTMRGSLGWYTARAFRANGHRVEQIDPGKPEDPGLVGKALFHTLGRIRINREIRNAAENADLFFLVGWNKYVSDRTLRFLEENGVRTANWFPDDLYRFPAMAERGSRFDDFYIIGDYPEEALTEWGVEGNSELLTFGYDPDIHTPGEGSEAHTADIGFIGTYTDTRGEVMRRIVDRFPDKSLTIIGNGWKNAPAPVQEHVHSEAVYAEDYVEALNSFTVTLNLHQPPMTPRGGPNMRVFETAACETFCLHDRKPEMQQLFGDALVTYGDVDELLQRLEDYLEAPGKREEAVEEAANAVEEHTYTNRLRQVT